MNQWIPILNPSSELGKQAWCAVDDIAEAIWSRNFVFMPPQSWHYREYDAAFLYAYIAVTCDDQVWFDRAIEQLNASIDNASSLTSYPALFGGLCGLGFTVQHVSEVLAQKPALQAGNDDADDGDLTGEIDGEIIKALRHANWNGAYDLISGLVGFGTYFLERLPARHSLQGIKLIVDHLEALSEHLDGGLAWHSGPELLPDWQRERCPDGYYNLGVAHGIPGILHFLSGVSAAGIDKRAPRILEEGMRWFIAQRRPAGSVSWFTSWLAPGESHDSRLTWCYGDLGILAVLLQAVAQVCREEWRDFTGGLLAHCLAWPVELTGVIDAPLCHGAAGVGHIFNRIYQMTGDVRCRDAAVQWFERTLAMRLPGTGIAGFSAATRPEPKGPLAWEAIPNFLDGAIGVGLALLGALTPVEPQWDRMLLLSGKVLVQDSYRFTPSES